MGWDRDWDRWIKHPVSRDSLRNEALAPEHRAAFRAYLCEDYDGIGQFVRIALSHSSVSSGIRARVPAGDFAANGRVPAGTPVICYSHRGFVEILGIGSAREPGITGTGSTSSGEVFPVSIVSAAAVGTPSVI